MEFNPIHSNPIFQKIRFGVIIRSIGERTEALCYESCAKNLPQNNIHIVRHFYPSYRAYDEMFRIAIDNQYDWYLALDADVILLPHWPSLIAEKLDLLHESNYLTFSHIVKDKFLGRIDRGNHCFNGRYAKKAKNILNEVTKYFVKPESSIKYYLKGIRTQHFPDQCIGYHGFEQYYKDIYYRFWNRRRRKSSAELEKKLMIAYHRYHMIDLDYEVALLGWKSLNFKDILLTRFWLKKSVPKEKTHKKIHSKLLRLGILEKKTLTITYDQFLQQHHYGKES